MVLQHPCGDLLAEHRGRPGAHSRAIAFHVIAGVDPKVGPYASSVIAVVHSLCCWRSSRHDLGSHRRNGAGW